MTCMVQIASDIPESEKERLETVVEMLATTQKDVVRSMILYCMDEAQDDWRSFFIGENLDDFNLEIEEDDGWDETIDLNAGVRPKTPEDVIEDDLAEEQFELSKQETEPTTMEDIEEEIDDL